MKKIIFVILLLVLVPACDLMNDLINDLIPEEIAERAIIIQEMHDYDFENDIIKRYDLYSIYDSMRWVAFNTKWISDGEKDYIQTPKETYNRINEDKQMLGDCEDHCSILCYILDQIGIESEVIMSYDVKASEKYGEDRYHALVYVPKEDIFIDAVYGTYVSYKTMQKEYPIIHSIPYEEFIWIAYNYHRLVGKYML